MGVKDVGNLKRCLRKYCACRADL